MHPISISKSIDNSTSYGAVAAEYYDENHHPTCANFRSASRFVFQSYAASWNVPSLTVCEVGAGKSLYEECVPNWYEFNQTLILNDSVPEMLGYSRRALEKGAHSIIGDARQLTLPKRSVDLILSSLGDPYNVDSFWKRSSETLKVGGTMLFTTPSHNWASRFRKFDSASQQTAEFLSSNGKTYHMPSYIYSVPDQIMMIERFGLKVIEFGSVNTSSLRLKHISPKLLAPSSGHTTIIDWYLVSN